MVVESAVKLVLVACLFDPQRRFFPKGDIGIDRTIFADSSPRFLLMTSRLPCPTFSSCPWGALGAHAGAVGARHLTDDDESSAEDAERG